MSMLELRQVSKVYGQGAAEVHALREVSLDVAPGMMMASKRLAPPVADRSICMAAP